jgi:hypothetical protein
MAVTGTVAVFTTNNSTGSAALVVAGSVVSLLAVFAEKIHTVDVGGIRVIMAAEAALQSLSAAETAELQGRTDAAAELRGQAERLLADSIGPIAEKYEQIRREQPRGPARTADIDRLLTDPENTRQMIDRYRDTTTVEALYDSGRGGSRIEAIKAMELRPEITSPRVLLDALRHPERGIEQYQSLLAIEAALTLGHLPEAEQSSLRTAIKDAVSQGSWPVDSDRRMLAERILRDL